MADATPVSTARGESIARRLPLLVAALLFAVVGTLCLLAYREMERALIHTSVAHANEVAAGLTEILDNATASAQRRSRTLAAMPEVRASLESGADVDTILKRSGRVNPNILGVGIRTAAPGWMVWADGRAADSLDARSSDAATGGRSATAAELGAMVREPQEVPASGIGPFRDAGGIAYYDVASPIPQAVGGPAEKAWLVVRHRLDSGEAARLIGRLVGDSAQFLTGSAATGVWTDLGASQEAPLETRAGTYTWNGKRYHGAMTGSTVTPWQVWVGLPRATVMAPASGVAGRLTVIAGLILLLGTFGAMILARHIARPIMQLTAAAEGISRGHYEEHVPVERRDEIGRLATAFNTMALRISDATHNLEDQVSTRTQELEQAVEELHEAQEQLVRREKLAMLGQLASGVGHELRNPLGVMTNAIYYLEMVQTDAPENVRDYLGIMRTQLSLAEKIIADLLDFSRLKAPDRQKATLETIAEQQLARLGATGSVDFRRDYADTPALFVDPVQVGQVVFNLLTNAAQATGDEGGIVTVRTRHDAGRTWLEIEDRGVGIEASHLSKIFEPLFTTKARGIGLGLSVSKSLAENNEGTLEVSSRQGHGATFTLAFASERGI